VRRYLWAVPLALVIAGCGSTPTPPNTPKETFQRPPKLPQGWTRRIDYSTGYSVGLPPGWSVVRASGGATVIQSPDKLVVVSISADRSSGLDSPLDQLARDTLAALGGYQGALQPGATGQVSGTPLDSATISSSGVSKHGSVRQTVDLAVLRRPRFVDYTVVIAANAAKTPASEREEAKAMLGTLRDVPPGPLPDPEGTDVGS
jgi:hypothetical protein